MLQPAHGNMVADNTFHCEIDQSSPAVSSVSSAAQAVLRAGLWLAGSPAQIDDQAADEQRSPENGGPDSDPLADEPSGYDGKDQRRPDSEGKEDSTGKSAHAD
jgi:hypothetical protein